MSRSVLVDEPAGPAEARFSSEHDGLTTLLNAKLIENPGNVVADRFLRELEGCGNLRVVKTLSNTFQHRTLAGSKFVEWQCIAVGDTHAFRFGEKLSHLRDQFRPRWLVRERHVVFTIKLNETALGNEPCQHSALFDRCDHVAFGMHNQYGTLDLARCFSHVNGPTCFKQADGNICRRRSSLLVAPRAYMVRRPARLKERGPYPYKVMILLSPADPREIAPYPRLIHLTWRTCPPQSALGIGTVEDETAHPLGMPDRIFDCDGTAPAGSHQGKLPEAGRLNHTFEIAHPGLE